MEKALSLDANVLIDADPDYYSIGRVPEFWDWLLYPSMQGILAIPLKIYDEVTAGKGTLVNWLKEHKDALVLDAEADVQMVKRVLLEGYAPDLTENEVEKIGNDPFIVAYALSNEAGFTVVTTEIST